MLRKSVLLTTCFVLLTVLVTLSISRIFNSDREYRETIYVFGTLVDIVIRGETVQKSREATSEIARVFKRVHVDWHAWKSGGELNELNEALARDEDKEISDELIWLLKTSQRLTIQSEGLFEPAIGNLIAAWGFHSDISPQGVPPTNKTILKLADTSPSLQDLVFDGHTVRSSKTSVRIDLGAVAKGAALDLAADVLKRRGIENAVLNAGGDLNVLGKYKARAWKVAIRDPTSWNAIASIDMRPGEVLYTSGNYERYLEHNGVRFSHILDPRTGYPVNDIISASVLHTKGMVADAAATALAVAGPEDWARIAWRMNVKLALLVDSRGRLYITPAMERRLKLLKVATDIFIVEPTNVTYGTEY
ncbi:MAG: FAD:protein FMN transferase [Hyphomicrobiaceae bacterium]|nr:FAD:protein FMN transferase [Hyphomicrobiaceae bacterium]